jgi:hypothetical protein
LPEKRSDWASHLEKERSLYIEFSRDLFKDKEGGDLKAAASSIQSMQNDKMYEPPPPPVEVKPESEPDPEQSSVQSPSSNEDIEPKVSLDPTQEHGNEKENTTEDGAISTSVTVKVKDDSVVKNVKDSNPEMAKLEHASVITLITDIDKDGDGEVARASKDFSTRSNEAVDKVRRRSVEDEELDEDEFLLYEISKDGTTYHTDTFDALGERDGDREALLISE